MPEIGWLGVIALAVWVTFAVAGLRSTRPGDRLVPDLRLPRLLGRQHGHADRHLAPVVICIVIGIPLGIWMARSKAVSTAVTPVLDLMQTMPAFGYLAPLALLFGIGLGGAPWC